MLEVETNHQIILLYFREGLSLRKIASQLKIHRDTVKRHISQYEQFRSAPASEQENPRSLLNQYLKVGRVYNSENRGKRKLTATIVDIIEACLDENRIKRNDGRIKQQLRKIDIHEKILAAGHSISYPIICAYITAQQASQKEAFIRQGFSAGSCCEFDWGEVKIRLDGKWRRYYLAVFTSAYSNYRYALLFQRQDSLAFKEAHICFFEHTGGVYRQMVYDNMRVAIAEFVGRTEKVPTAGLLQLSRWYQYQWRFCNTAKGNEKGHVERSVEYVRRKVFGFTDTFTSLAEAQQYLQDRVSELNGRPGKDLQDSPAAKLELERKGLHVHPGRMECFAAENCKVDKYATISFGTNRYSVPDHLIGKMVFVKIYSQWLSIYDAERVLCRHQRLYERHCWQIDLNHYLVTLHRKPGAVAGSIALKQAPEWIRSMYADHFIHDTRSFIELLQYCQLNGIDHQQLKSTVDQLSHGSSAAITTQHVIALLGNHPEEAPADSQEPDPITLQALENLMELAAMMN